MVATRYTLMVRLVGLILGEMEKGKRKWYLCVFN